MTEEKVVLPDGGTLTKARKVVLAKGFDHYWRFHDKSADWAEWCPFCKKQEEIANG